MTAEFAYIGREPGCGCATVGIADTPEHAKDVARDIAQCVRWGMSIERVSIEEARTAIGSCPHWRIDSRNRRHRVEAVSA